MANWKHFFILVDTSAETTIESAALVLGLNVSNQDIIKQILVLHDEPILFIFSLQPISDFKIIVSNKNTTKFIEENLNENYSNFNIKIYKMKIINDINLKLKIHLLIQRNTIILIKTEGGKFYLYDLHRSLSTKEQYLQPFLTKN